MQNKFVPLVSIVIPCFNPGISLLRAIESLGHQSYNNIEIILVDDGSSNPLTFENMSIHFPQTLRIIRHQINKGLPCARNTGFSNAKGDYVVFLDADDWFSEDAIEHMVQAIPTGNDKFFVYCDITFEGSRTGVSSRIYKPFSQFFFNHFPYSILISRKAITWSPLYCEEFIDGLEDWDLNLKLIESGYCPIRVSKPLFHYFVSEKGMFSTITKGKYFSIWKFIQSRRKGSYALKNLSGLAISEWRIHGTRSIFPSVGMLVLSKLPLESLLNRVFKAIR